MNAKKEFEKMSLEELIEWSESGAPDDVSSATWSDWESEVKKKAKKHFWNMDFCELNKFYREHPHEDIPPWSDAWIESIKGSWPFEEIFSHLISIKKSLDVILKKIGLEDAGISINQLIRLKGGHTP